MLLLLFRNRIPKNQTY